MASQSSSPSLSGLPNELLLMICLWLAAEFDPGVLHFPQIYIPSFEADAALQGLCALTRTSKRFSELAKQALYRNVVLIKPRAHLTLLRSIIYAPHLSKYVRSMVIANQGVVTRQIGALGGRLQASTVVPTPLCRDVIWRSGQADTQIPVLDGLPKLGQLWFSAIPLIWGRITEPLRRHFEDHRDEALAVLSLAYRLPNLRRLRYMFLPLPPGQWTNEGPNRFHKNFLAAISLLGELNLDNFGMRLFPKLEELDLACILDGDLSRTLDSLVSLNRLSVRLSRYGRYPLELPAHLATSLRDLHLSLHGTAIPESFHSLLRSLRNLERLKLVKLPGLTRQDSVDQLVLGLESRAASLRELCIEIAVTETRFARPLRVRLRPINWSRFSALRILQVPDITVYGTVDGEFTMSLPPKIECLGIAALFRGYVSPPATMMESIEADRARYPGLTSLEMSVSATLNPTIQQHLGRDFSERLAQCGVTLSFHWLPATFDL
ncbi:hypothetical protein BJX61DRAFT_541560 [Aspergillus egyptiacus]|nr:hypothetical protein BJX61DRAFT_541560 [Aspergillus egyptiacus]